MAKHVYPPLNFGVADTSSIDLDLSVARIITAQTLFGGSGGDLGTASTSARSDHTHITSYDGRYVLKAGDTITGNLTVNGDVTLNNSLIVSGVGIFNLNITANAGLSVTASGATIAGGVVISSGGLSVTGTATLNNALNVSGISTLNSLIVTTSATIGTTLSTSGLATLNSAAVTNNATVGGTLGVTGNTTHTTLSSSGLATLNSLAVTNAATVGGTLGVTGAVTLSNLAGTGTRLTQAGSGGLLSAVVPSTIGSSVVLLATNSPSAVVSSSFTSLFTAEFEHYLITGDVSTSAAADIYIRLRASSTDYSGANYNNMHYNLGGGGAIGSSYTANATTHLVSASGGQPWSTMHFVAYITISPNGVLYPGIMSHAVGRTGTVVSYAMYNTDSIFANLSGVDGLTVLCAGAVTMTGKIRLYGIRL